LAELDAGGLTLEGFFDLPEYQARRFLNNQPTIARSLRRDAASADLLDQIAGQLERERIRLIAINDSNYPERLLNDLGFDAPTFLYVCGRLGHLRSPTVAMVGTRSPSPQGLESARAYADALAREGIHIVSGHARGIDVASHEGALAAGGSTTLVLPCGIFAFQSAPTLRPLMTHDNALILSQFPPNAATTRYSPPHRNTTMAGLADGVIVVETRLTGGPSYTFREARRLRKPLWTILYPEPVPPSASGNHSLLSAGAEALEPGEAGAERCAGDVAQCLRAVHAHRPTFAVWPPPESPGQEELF
jgi:DNA processing protein